MEIDNSDEALRIVGTRGMKVTKIGGLEEMTNLKELVLRSNLLGSMEGVETLTLLEKLELYDNHVPKLLGLENMSNLLILDMSFNNIRDLSPVAALPQLEELYVAQNKLRRMTGIANLTNLKLLDLGANRIREIEQLEGLTKLKSLWLGKNKITDISGISSLGLCLQQLDIQSNRLTSLPSGSLAHLSRLQELYLAHNAIERIEEGALPVDSALSTIDLTSNALTSLSAFLRHTQLEELWLGGNALADMSEVSTLLALPHLTCLYLEHCPLATPADERISAMEPGQPKANEYRKLYRKRVLHMLPNLTQLDATLVSAAEKAEAAVEA